LPVLDLRLAAADRFCAFGSLKDSAGIKFSGAEGDRTLNLSIANATSIETIRHFKE
jgi:hypothetical protein